jgi:signal transduction histidine kinase
MIFNNYQSRLAIRLALLFASAFGAAFLFAYSYKNYFFVLIPVICWQFYDLFMLLKRAQEEVKEFAESVHYRDFSRYFNVKQAPSELQPLRIGFNEINNTFKEIRGEKEMQYQYLQKILELVDTGIISFKTESKEINWLNDTFKRMLDIPYMRTIDALAKRDMHLYEEVIAIKPGEHKIFTVKKDGRELKLLISATIFQTEGVAHKIVAFQNINEALDETESKAWQKLLSVMTHEIMNSVAPISSLADTLGKNLQFTLNNKPDSFNDWDDLQLGLETIKRRSEGLLKFSESFRSLNKITRLNLSKISVSTIFEDLTTLMSPMLDQQKIQLDTILKEPQLEIVADFSLLEQVMINLIVNAMDAVKGNEHKVITLSAYSEKGKVILKVADNGAGIEPDVLDKIFIPFFSTKKTGSGIGLSLCKQIMLLHKGSIHVQSELGKGTAFFISI